MAQTTEYDYIDGDSLTAGSWFVVNPDRLMAVEARVAMPKKKDGQKALHIGAWHGIVCRQEAMTMWLYALAVMETMM